MRRATYAEPTASRALANLPARSNGRKRAGCRPLTVLLLLSPALIAVPTLLLVPSLHRRAAATKLEEPDSRLLAKPAEATAVNPRVAEAQQQHIYDSASTPDPPTRVRAVGQPVGGSPTAHAHVTPNPQPPSHSHNEKHCEAFELHTDTDLLHGDLGETPAQEGSSLDACCALCSEQRGAGCRGLTLTPGGECWLKSSAAQPSKQRGLTSALVRPVSGQHGALAQHADAAPPERRAQHDGLAVAAPTRRRPRNDACSRDAAIGCMPDPAVVVMSHDRPEMTRRCLKNLFDLDLADKFTVYVSEDANSATVRAAAREFGGRVKEVLSSVPHVGTTPFAKRGLAKIAQHFKAALEATLVTRGHSHVVMIEDDLLLSPDFLRLFWSSAWLLHEDPSIWCVSAWNDQGFPHTAHDPARMQRTDYFPGLGWMITAELWSELRTKWPEAPTTGWDHWMRLSSTSKGRECVAAEINRSRHASKRGTNVLDNKPFERFTFETKGVSSFGDLSYLLRENDEPATAAAVSTAKRHEWPSAWGGSMAAGAGQAWMAQLPTSTPNLLLYTREQYKELAKPLGLWAESQRATHNGTIKLHTQAGATVLLADRRKCPYLSEGERMQPPASMQQIAAKPGLSCSFACKQVGAKCEAKALEWGNNCEAMARLFPCEKGCGHQVGPELPAYASSSDLDTYQQCLISDIAFSTCEASFKKTSRLCTCVPE